MKIYICPECGWLRLVSRRKEVECFQCGNPDMQLTRLTHEKYSQMNEQERADYARRWQMVHAKA